MPFGWRLWQFSWTPARPGHYSILARARDSSGDAQPAIQEWNPSGYLWNVVARVDIDAGQSAAPAAAAPGVPEPAPPAGFRDRCLVCHDEDVIRQQRLTPAQWDREINKMTGWGARLMPDERQPFLDYLSKVAGPRR
jgi:hypothetical protein